MLAKIPTTGVVVQTESSQSPKRVSFISSNLIKELADLFKGNSY